MGCRNGDHEGIIVSEKFVFEEETNLTVHKTSMFFYGDGFLVYDPNGEVIFRFDSYDPHDSISNQQLVLMDASGNCLLSLLPPKMLSLHQRWEGYLGEKREDQDPLFTIHRSRLIERSTIIVENYCNPGEKYRIEGSYGQRCCSIYKMISTNTNMKHSKECVAKIKRKMDPTTHVLLGKDVFCLSVKPGFDAAFAMGLVLVLDRMCSDDDEDHSS